MIKYVKTHIDPMKDVISELSPVLGVGYASQIVKQWFSENSEFVYDKNTGDLLFAHSRFYGTWTANDDALPKYK